MLGAALLLAATHGAHATPLLDGVTSGPDSDFSINLTFSNLSTAGEIITSLFLDGSTATAYPVLWDSIGTLSGQTATVSGLDTQLVDFSFTSSWDPTESFSLSGMDPDGDPGPVGLTIGELAGVTVGATFSTGATARYRFVDDPAEGAGLRLAAVSVAEPGALALLGIGLAGFAAARRGKQ